MKKILILFLILILIVSVFASCGGGGTSSTPKASTPKTPSDPDAPDEQVPENEQINLDLDSIDYDDTTIHVFHWQPASGDISGTEFGMELEDIANDAINDAVYRRNLNTETALGIKLDWTEQGSSTYWKTQQFIDALESRISDPNTPVDIIAGCIRSMPFFMIEGHLTELNTYSDSLDLSKVWWPENIQDAIAIKGNLYFVSGDIAASVLQNMTVLYVNKTHLEQKGQNYVEFMEKIKNYEWTLDDLIALTNNEYQNLDDVPGPSEGDSFGLITLYYKSDGLYTGLGYKYMVKSTRDDEAIRLSSQLAGESAMQYVQKMKDWQETNDFFMKYTDAQEDNYYESFKNGLSLFCLDRGALGFELQDTEIKYACIPAPALDLNQKRYYTNVQSSYTGYGICSASPEYDISAQTIQVLGYNAYLTTTPAIFEVSFQGKFSKDDYNIEMFNIIRESIVFDVGKIYDVLVATQIDGFVLPDFLESIVSNVVSYGIKGNEYGQDTNFNFISMGDPVRKHVQESIDLANAKILEYIASQS